MALEDLARPKVQNLSKISGRFAEDTIDFETIKPLAGTPDKSTSSPSDQTLRKNFSSQGRAKGRNR